MSCKPTPFCQKCFAQYSFKRLAFREYIGCTKNPREEGRNEDFIRSSAIQYFALVRFAAKCAANHHNPNKYTVVCPNCVQDLFKATLPDDPLAIDIPDDLHKPAYGFYIEMATLDGWSDCGCMSSTE